MSARDPHTGDRLIRVSTAATVVGIGGIAAVVSFRHALEVVRQHGESGVTAFLTPLTVDGLVFTASMVLLDSARRGDRAPWLGRVALALGIAATIAVNVLHGLAHGPIGAVVGAWPAVTLILVVELLMGMIRRARQHTPSRAAEEADVAPAADPAPAQSAAAAPEPVASPNGDGPAEDKPSLALVPAPARTGPDDVPAVPGVPAEVRPMSLTEPNGGTGADPARVRAARVFAEDLRAGQVPSIRRIKSALRCGQDKATQVRAYLAALDVQ